MQGTSSASCSDAREKGIVAGVHEERRHRDAAEDGLSRSRASVVVGVADPCRGAVTTSSNSRSVRARRIAHRRRVRENARACPRPFSSSWREMRGCNRGSIAAERTPAAMRSTGRHRGCRGEDVLRPRVLSEPLEKRIAAERHAPSRRAARRKIRRASAEGSSRSPPHRPSDRLAESVRSPEQRESAAPRRARSLPELARRAHERNGCSSRPRAVKQHNERSNGRTCQTIDIDEIAVRRVPAFRFQQAFERRSAGVQGLQVCAGTTRSSVGPGLNAGSSAARRERGHLRGGEP